MLSLNLGSKIVLFRIMSLFLILFLVLIFFSPKNKLVVMLIGVVMVI